MLNIAIAAGGTGGHIFPGISIAEKFISELDNVNVIFIGSKNGIENRIVKKYGFNIVQIDVHKLYRYYILKNLLFPIYLIRSILQAKRIFQNMNIDIFIGCGGFVSGSAGLSALWLRLPFFLQEQNSFPGVSTRLLAKSCKRLYIGNLDAKQHFKSSRLVGTKIKYTGNPIRKFKKVRKQEALTFWNFKDKKTIFIYGGSQGSHSLNKNFSVIIDKILKKDIQIIFQTGFSDFKEINNKFGNRKGMVIQPFFDNIEYAYSASDLAICRAGAISLTEISHFGLPAILIPFPYSAGQHQLKNAKSFVKKGAAEMITEDELNPKILFCKILDIINDKNRLLEMSSSLKSLVIQDSAKRIVDDIIEHFVPNPKYENVQLIGERC
ncbi:MAG: undecaprenyldiphospho-muramoylpentapeptide beta-N-acetylglucosaminyltransferase [Candidatus Cloacimonetes bacterium]|nr:undecaprenyldiphospho-muramoylpentapeptide beta-N-acetylglucosaminyltransferase [Candidatus Cloacimonadota bacterium]